MLKFSFVILTTLSFMACAQTGKITTQTTVIKSGTIIPLSLVDSSDGKMIAKIDIAQSDDTSSYTDIIKNKCMFHIRTHRDKAKKLLIRLNPTVTCDKSVARLVPGYIEFHGNDLVDKGGLNLVVLHDFGVKFAPLETGK